MPIPKRSIILPRRLQPDKEITDENLSTCHAIHTDVVPHRNVCDGRQLLRYQKNGRVYQGGKVIGDTSMTQATIGFQLGGSGFSQVIFFEDQRALNEFTDGRFEFGADAQAVALTAAVGGSAKSSGSSATASGGKNNADTIGMYYKGMATFTITKGGLMYEASVGGQKFTFKPRQPEVETK